ncbi:hypothetical protein ACFO9Q_12465 [Paenibacillus sp. GCM10023252]|uniref:hypothetical protein n=1 Tax=Paenibacillus sp. GCM10023252 TaxID=3252649 RepID=UPI00360F15AC
MFQHMFATMNDMLQHIIQHYPSATPAQREQFEEQLAMLKKVSDSLIEQWLQLEEKFAIFRNEQEEAPQQSVAAALEESVYGAVGASPAPKVISSPNNNNNTSYSATDGDVPFDTKRDLTRGQGYYHLFMFQHAREDFLSAVTRTPENNLARLFLAMTHMHLQEWSEAQRHFQLLIALTEHPKWQALGLNALGCIQAVHLNMEQAEQFFLKAHQAYPAFADPLSNLKCCKETPGELALYFGSTELSCL